MIFAVFVLCVVMAACGPTMDERQPASAARAASYLNGLTSASKTPGIQYVVVNATGVVFEYAGGWADIRRQVPVDAATTMVADPAHHATGYLEKYSLMNLVKGLLIDRDLIGDYSGRWLEIRSHYLNGPAFGGLVGTARGFGKFLQDQLRPRSALLNEATRSFLYAPQQTKQGTAIAMTLGWHMRDLGDHEGTRFFFKEGGGGGFHSMMRVYPDDGIGTVVMTNATGFDVRRMDANSSGEGSPHE